MLYYFSIIAICCLLSIFIVKCNVRNRWTILDFFILVILILFAGFRDHVGTDYQTYYDIYNRIVTTKFNIETFYNTNQEIGYYLLSVITKKISKSDIGIFISSSCLTYIFIYSRIKKESEDFVYSILLFFLMGIYTGPFNIVRQWIAISLNFYSEKYIESNTKRFFFINILASLFHISAFPVMILQRLTRKIKLNRKIIFIFIFTMFIIFSLSYYLPLIASIAQKINPRYAGYLQVGQSGLGIKLLLVIKIGILLFALINKRKIINERYVLYLMIAVLFNILGLYYVIIYRFVSYFDIFLVLLIPEILKKCKKYDRVIYKYSFFLLYTCVFVLSILNYGDLLPYSSYLF